MDRAGVATTDRKLCLQLDGRSHELEPREGETIFAAARRAEVLPPFSCLGGYCGECIATLEEGEVTMKVNKALSPKQTARGLILTCQAVPSTRYCRVRYAPSS